MKTKILLLLFIMVSVSTGFAQFQYWYATNNYDWPRALTPDSKDGYFVAGSTLSGTWHPFIMRVDQKGNFLWSKTYKLEGIDDHFLDIITIPGGSDRVVAVGQADAYQPLGTSFDDYLVITGGDGTLIKAKRFYTREGDVATHIEPYTNPLFGTGFAISGYTYHNLTTLEKDMHIVLTDGGGNMVNSAVYLSKLNQSASWVIPTSDNGFLLVGETELKGSCDNNQAAILLVKLNSSLNVIWDRTYDLRPQKGYSLDRPSVVAEDTNGDIHIVGTSHIYIDSVADHYEPFQLHLRKDGSVLWVNLYEAKDYPSMQTVSVINNVTLDDGSLGYVLGGRAFDPFEALLFQTNGKGDVTWARTYPADYVTSNTNAEDLTTNKIKGYSFTGRRFNGAPPSTAYDIHLVETDAYGKTGESCEQEIGIVPYRADVCVDQLYLKEKRRMYEMNVTPVVQPMRVTTYNCAEEIVSATAERSGQLSPNPAETVVAVPGYAGAEAMIYDLQGVLKKKAVVTRDGEVNVADLQEGIYILKLVDETGATHEFRFMKN